jgi:hypothetical protein
MDIPRVTFGIIVLNGQPFLPYNVRALYRWAHQIIICEGASPNAKHAASEDGHSIDGTLEYLRDLKNNSDPEGKIIIVTAEDEGHRDGFWAGEKDEQSQAYAKRATGDWLWQVDVDEFYRDQDIQTVYKLLAEEPDITAVTFPEIPFWGSFDYRCDGPYLRYHYSKFHRLFRWGKGYEYQTHRPPTILDENAVNLRSKRWLTSEEMAERGVYLHHYTQIFSQQVRQKMTYYENLTENVACDRKTILDVDKWYDRTFSKFKDPLHVHTVNAYPSWLVKYTGDQPEVIYQLRRDIESGLIAEPTRNMEDVERVLRSPEYLAAVRKIKIQSNFIGYPIRLMKDLLKRRIGVVECTRRLINLLDDSKRVFPLK